MAGRVAGKVAVITGGASGLGLAAAKLMAAEGAQVVITDIQQDKGQQAAREIGGDALFLEHNVASESSWTVAIDRAVERFGKINVLVNSAGIAGPDGSIEQVSLRQFQRMMAVNAEGTFLGCQNAVRVMKGNGELNSIVNISSVAGLVSGWQMACYSPSKAAVRLLTKSVALHCARAGYPIRCNSVHPAFIDTPMVQGGIDADSDPDKARKRLVRMVPMGRIGEPNDIGYMILYLASDESKFTTGAEMVIDGGCTAI
ncbi:glucose 1-dehydrogenase [Vineibacter terrae]|uniref:glucose 1-dehydrogenase n=1 Tax=Vineibacter terrae TaxID=2586908 RepID=UPI002E3319BA|nr:glucose 1-dehydrogenase [Vineibacter terrae]HEX2887352.1 glucose 1-dehydrogenase [Vineibacter terrae]